MKQPCVSDDAPYDSLNCKDSVTELLGQEAVDARKEQGLQSPAKPRKRKLKKKKRSGSKLP